MIFRNLTFCWFTALTFLGAVRCQGPEGGGVLVHLQFPQTLKQPASRYRSFLEQAAYIELEVRTESGQFRRLNLAPHQWRELQLDGIRFPQGEADVLRVKARVWARDDRGQLRAFPVLEGSGRLEAGDTRGGLRHLGVRMRLRVPPESFAGLPL